MDEDVKVWLYDILNAIVEIESFFRDGPQEFQEFENDIRTKRAVERNIEIIGEAMNRVLYRDEAIVITNSRKFFDVRNRIITVPYYFFRVLHSGSINRYFQTLTTFFREPKTKCQVSQESLLRFQRYF